MNQISFLDAEYNQKKKKTRREIFLESMEQVVPWKRLEKWIKKHYSSASTGRPAYPGHLELTCSTETEQLS